MVTFRVSIHSELVARCAPQIHDKPFLADWEDAEGLRACFFWNFCKKYLVK